MFIIVNKDLRGRFGSARDQDPRPTCMVFAASDAHAGARPGWVPLSVEWVYYHALNREGGVPHRGVHMATVLDALRSDGQPAEDKWPYIASLFVDVTAWKPPAANPIFKRDSSSLAASVNGIIAQLDADRPVLFTMSVSRTFFAPDTHGVVAATEPLEPKRVHALVAVGHGRRDQNRFILVRNSWGEHWGLAGHAWVDANYLAPRLKGAAIMTGEI
jgi:hypothetical protein